MRFGREREPDDRPDTAEVQWQTQSAGSMPTVRDTHRA